MIKIKLKKFPYAKNLSIPEFMTEKSACVDLYAADSVFIESGKIEIVPTGIALSIPKGYEAQIRPRSGLAAKYNVTVLNSPGTIDSDYRGEIKVILINHGDRLFYATFGMRIAQMCLKKVIPFGFEEVNELDETDRSDGGFGHTGL